LSSLESFQRGLFEIQDEGSQLMTLLSGAQPGERVLDLCAGAGGKTLALAAMMENKGHLLATDIASWRLERARLRARRAGVFNGEFHPLDASWLRRKKKSFHRVLLDVPCSGTGAWRRTPEKKWRLCIEDLPSLREEQAKIFNLGAELVKPGGVLLYGTCSLLQEENHQQVTAFLSTHPDFEVDSVAHILEPTIASSSPSVRPFLEAQVPAEIAVEKLLVKKNQPHLMNLQGGDFLELRPHQTNTDGFFLARLKRKQDS
jgi:16S rRNA (cytosine967-C5)-methyltransferase